MEVPLTTSKVEETLSAIEGRKEYYLKKRQSVKDGTYDADKDPEAQPKKAPTANGVASTSHGPAANGDSPEDFEHVSRVHTFCVMHVSCVMHLLIVTHTLYVHAHTRTRRTNTVFKL